MPDIKILKQAKTIALQAEIDETEIDNMQSTMYKDAKHVQIYDMRVGMDKIVFGVIDMLELKLKTECCFHPDLHCSDSNRRRQTLKDQMSFEGTLTKTVRYRSVFQESVQRPRGVLREPISLSVTCYSFYKVSTHFFIAALLPHLGTYHALGCGFHLSLFCFRFHSHEGTYEKTEIA